MDKKLGFGLMRLPLTDPNNNGSIDIEQLKEMVDVYLQRGFTYFDTAWMYCDGQSECAVNEVLTKRYPRDAFTVTSKLPNGPLNSLEDRDKIFNEQLRKTGLEYFDYYLLHAIGPQNIDRFLQFDCFTWLMEKKAQGLAKKIGFSFHGSPELLEDLLSKYTQLDVVQLQINYLDWENEKVRARECHEIAVRHGKSIIIMEPVRGGALADVPPNVQMMFRNADPQRSVASWAIRFAASLENVMMVLSGMSNLEQVLDNTDYMRSFQPLTADEMQMALFAGKIIGGQAEIACTGCAYCIERCPKNIAIAQYFSAFNKNDKAQYEALIQSFGKASDCIGCGQCEKACPQQLPIRGHLKSVAERFED
ncbi:MAG: aldo/keto reductase [Oscillospiraceae bacterium]|nr:aldo/keto reductase [Oscillospiraceae bacterium]